ncbi:HAMP domain-containing protein [uncultured Ferrimonas sp.]|uniref:HAMP domain-containing protein n=1 Tax=uncultured Ferrimonas sp. TaxID=432640 RepID=UPI00261A4A58|nr:HAMP domain-containing protein [uncultured Ferrimonas sp.]
MAGWLLTLVLIQTAITLVGAIWLTSKLSGPVYAIHRALEQLAEGNLSAEVDLREGDDMRELAESINDCSARIQIMVMGLKENLLALQQSQHRFPDPELSARLAVIQQNLEWFDTISADYEEPVS